MEAEKIKKKLNGSILKGHKVRVEEARPDKKMKRPREGDVVNDIGEEHTVKKARKTKTKQEPRDGILPGYELPESRKVERGWTESQAEKNPKSKKDKKQKKTRAKASSLTGKPECLFRTKVPPNAVKIADVSRSNPTAKPNKKGKSSREVVVHEFTNTTKHAKFLRESQNSQGQKAVSDYIDGKGWVDKNGDVVEPESLTYRTRSKPKKDTVTIDDNGTSPSDTGSNSSQGDSSPNKHSPKLLITSLHHEADDETSSSGTSSISGSKSEADEEVSETSGDPTASLEASDESSVNSSENEERIEEKIGNPIKKTRSTSRSTSSMSLGKETDTTPKANDSTTEPEPESKEVHPLEALFKRPKSTASSSPRKPTLEVRTSFSFFDPDAAEEGSSRITIPQTPFTQRDIQERRLRSAAPTPDTAAPGKTFANVWAGDLNIEEADEDKEEEEEDTTDPDPNNTPPAGKGHTSEEDEKGKPHESDFAKWFWEHRGETNRAWKKRRREAAKEKRQRENRTRGRSAV